MTSSNIFSLPVPVYRQPRLPSKHDSCAKKRKRAEVAENDEAKNIDTFSEPDQPQHVHSQRGSQFSEYSAVLTPDERSQYRIAGQPSDHSPPTNPFPHAPQPKLDDPPDTKHGTSHRLANLDPPIYVPSPDARNLPLHQQHLGALTALLHRALSEGDFARAGRALSLILRDEIGGNPLDIRAEGRWGVGAEVLLRQGTHIDYSKNKSSTARANSVENLRKSERGSPTWFTRKGFEDAKKYYERLIVQYPFHKLYPGAVSALDFYPAMFGLWIYVVHEESKFNNEPPEESSVSEMSHAEDSMLPETRPPFDLALKQRTLEQAREIAIRMDSCMTTIPYSDDVELIRLRGMVALWIADLIEDILEVQNSPYNENEDDSVEADEDATGLTSRSPMQGSAGDANRALRLEADRAKDRSVEMERKIQAHQNRLG